MTVQTEDAGDSDASADMMKQNAEGVISNLNQAMAQATGEEIAATPFDTSVTQTDIVRQVVDEIKLNLSKDVTSMTLQLNPEQLGKYRFMYPRKWCDAGTDHCRNRGGKGSRGVRAGSSEGSF